MATARGCIAGACAYGAWVALTDSAKRQVDHWGPDWVVRLLQLGGAAVMNALGVRWAHALDDARGVAAVRAGRAGGIGAVSPHGPYAHCAIIFGMPYFRLEENFGHFREEEGVNCFRHCSSCTFVLVGPGELWPECSPKLIEPECDFFVRSKSLSFRNIG